MAKTETTVKGYVYTVTSPNGGTVTDAEGKLNKTVEAGDQVTVTAPSDSLTCDDDEAVICKANFKVAPGGNGAGGGAERLPLGCTRALFLESDGTQYIDTQLSGRAPDAFVKFKGVAQAFNRRAFQGNGFGTSSVRQGRSDFYVLFPLADGVQQKSGYLSESRTPPYKLEITVKPELVVYGGKTYSAAEVSKESTTTTITERTLKLGSYADGASYQNTWWIGTCERFHAKMANGEINLIPILDPAGIPCMYDTVNGAVFRNAGTGQFILGMTNEQASKLGMVLPAGGGELTISLPAGWQGNAKVSTSLALAESRGWDIFPRTTEDAKTAATTFALRRVWVRKIADDRGTYEAADGTRWRVEWCEEVFSSSTPEELGFERFRSVDAAADYWELVPYVDPNAEEPAI